VGPFCQPDTHQLKLQDHGYGASALRGVPVYFPDFAGTHLPTPEGWHAELAFAHGSKYFLADSQRNVAYV